MYVLHPHAVTGLNFLGDFVHVHTGFRARDARVPLLVPHQHRHPLLWTRTPFCVDPSIHRLVVSPPNTYSPLAAPAIPNRARASGTVL